MPSTLIDSAYYRDTVSSEAMRTVFSDENRFATWLEVEVTLADVQANLGIIPKQAAANIAAVAKLGSLNIPAMKEHYQRVGFPIVPLVKQLGDLCDPESARWIHWGATTQDIVDTGLALQIRQALDLVESDVNQLVAALKELSSQHRHTLMVGRTFQQHAAPITFGFKTAVWLDELLRHRERLTDVRQRALICQFGGAVGTLATLSDQGMAVREGLAKQLGLIAPNISWHTSRDGWAEVIFCLASIGATLAKIAIEISMLMRTEVDEVREPFQPGRGASSTMPQKRNPIACPIIIAIGNRLREHVSSQLTAMVQEHERGVAAMPLEWMVIPEAFLLLSGALQHMKQILPNLDIDARQMRANLDHDNGLLMAEAVMMGLANHTGRPQAHELVTTCANAVREQNITLREALLENPIVREILPPERIDQLLDPRNYLGSCDAMIERVLSACPKD